MSQFTYAKIAQYSNEVVDFVLDKKNKDQLRAIDGNYYTIDTSKNSTFEKFRSLVKKRPNADYDAAEKLVRQKQFEVLAPHTRDKKYFTLGWTELEKKEFSSPDLKITTEEQETISLLIIKNVLGDDTQKWNTFADMFNAGFDARGKPVSGIAKIFPKLNDLPDWWNNFNLQFEQIKQKANLKNDSYNVYLYNENESFMKYISDLVTKDMDLYSQKDSWNPADIWLIKSKANEQTWKNKFNAIAEELKTGLDAKGRVGQYTEDPYLAIQHINLLLQKAHKKREIVGISLKKSDGKTLNYAEFNLEAKASEQDLPVIKLNGIKLDCSYDKTKHQFKSKTSYVYVKDKIDDAYKLAYKSNTGTSTPGNITYEFLPTGKASAQLGKVPKDELKKWLKEQVDLYKGTEKLEVRMPQWQLLPQKWSDDDLALRKKKVELIKKEFGHYPEVNVPALDNYITNLADSYLHGPGVTVANAAIMQMIDFTWILAKLQEQKKLTNFITLNFYFAQKKGIKYNFGPFGKVY